MKQICLYIRILLSLALFAFIALSCSSGDLKKSDEEPEKTDTTSDSENLIESKWFPEGLAPVMIDGKWGFIDKTGKITINPQFDLARSFSEGLAPVKIDGKWGFIDKTGQFVINPQFVGSCDFSEGLAIVYVVKGGTLKFGFIDKTGQYVINPQFDFAFDFSEGLAPVKIAEKWGFIDKTGQFVINPQFDGIDLLSILSP